MTKIEGARCPEIFLVTISYYFDIIILFVKIIKVGIFIFELVFDNMVKPINVGVIIRLACATGSKLYFTGNSVDYQNRKARLAAVGYEDKVDLTYFKDFNVLIEKFKGEGKLVAGTSPKAQRLYTEINYKMPMVLVFGNEATGLSKEKISSRNH